MNDLSFNNNSNQLDSIFFLQHFIKDFDNFKYFRVVEEEKKPNQKEFEQYLKSRDIVVVDYVRIITNVKYFETLTLYLKTTRKKTLLWNSLQLAYISPKCLFYSYNLPKKPTLTNFVNIYDYLFADVEERPCYVCQDKNPFYYCTNCGSYLCRKCVYQKLKCVMRGNNEEIYYIYCPNCEKFHIIYNMPIQ